MDKIRKSDQQWREELGEEVFHVCRMKGTERPFSGEYYANKAAGIYRCACCGEPLFDAAQKYDSGSGWPSFWAPLNDDCVAEQEDNSHGMQRQEILCRRCDAHLGHVFSDGPQPTGLRYCVNSLSLKFEESGG